MMHSPPQIQFLQQQGFSTGMVEAVARLQPCFPLRIWILDNSQAMLVRDSHRIAGTFQDIHNVPNVSRWEELQDCVAFHSQLASKLQLRTRFSLLNPPTEPGLPQYFSVHESPVGSSSPSSSLQQQHQQEMETVRRVMTQTRPVGPAPLIQHLQALQTYLRSIAHQLLSQKQTVSVILTTQGLPTAAVASGPLLSTKVEVDVLDDFFGESLEIYLRNPWLTYGLPLHRFREAGFRVAVLDTLDERALTIQEARQLCDFLFGTTSTGPLPDPAQNWNAFFQSVSRLQSSREKLQWNPVTRKLTPWINLHDLNRLYGGQPTPLTAFASYYQQQYHQQQQSPPYYQHSQTRSGFAVPPPPQPQQQQSHPASAQNHPMHQNFNSQSSPAPNQMPTPQALQKTVSTSWAMLPPLYQQPRPIDYLLATIQSTFPPAFGIQRHAYFDKWKPFSSDALASKQQAVLARAVRKCRFFLHPDRLPSDLDNQQRALCKALWNVVSDAWDVARKE